MMREIFKTKIIYIRYMVSVYRFAIRFDSQSICCEALAANWRYTNWPLASHLQTTINNYQRDCNEVLRSLALINIWQAS